MTRTPRPGLFWPVRVDGDGRGGPTRHQARGERWRRSSRGLYVPAGVQRSVEQRIVEAAAVLPEHGAVTGWAALRWHGGRWFEGTGAGRRERAVTLVTNRDDIRDQPGIAVSAERLRPTEVELVDGVRVTSAARSVLFEVRHAETLRDAVAVLDLAAYSDLVSIAEVVTEAELLAGWTGIPQARSAFPLTSENAWSPMEVALRLVWELDAELPRPLANAPVFDRHGHHVGTPDLLDEEAGLVVEYDGAAHFSGRQRARDLHREDRFRRVGLVPVTVVGAELGDVTALVSRLLAARAAALDVVPLRRLWTLDPPSWWCLTGTVQRRRALDDRQRKRWLAYRDVA